MPQFVSPSNIDPFSDHLHSFGERFCLPFFVVFCEAVSLLLAYWKKLCYETSPVFYSVNYRLNTFNKQLFYLPLVSLTLEF